MAKITKRKFEDATMFIAENGNGKFLGSAIVAGRQGDQTANLDSIQTNYHDRGQGVGSTLLSAVIGYALEIGANILTGEFKPECTANPKEVRKFYEKRGFTIDEKGNLRKEL